MRESLPLTGEDNMAEEESTPSKALAETKPEGTPEPKPAAGTPEGKPEPQGGNTPEQGSERWNQVYARMKAAEDKSAKLEKAQSDKDAAHLVEQGKYKELYEGAKGKAAQVDELNAAVQTVFDAAVKGISEDQLSLVPDLPVHKKLEWVTNAKAKGMLTDTEKKPDPAKTFDGKPVNTAGKWWLTIDSKDERFNSLTSEQYGEWKAQRDAALPPKPRAVGF